MNKFMNIAIKEAIKAKNKGDVPVGATIVLGNRIISKAHNKKEHNKNATKHAEIIAISKACKKIHSWHLDNCTIYCTMEPCMMCCGALLQSRIKKVVYLVKNEKYGCTHLIKNSKIEFIEMKDNIEMKKILNDFFQLKR